MPIRMGAPAAFNRAVRGPTRDRGILAVSVASSQRPADTNRSSAGFFPRTGHRAIVKSRPECGCVPRSPKCATVDNVVIIQVVCWCKAFGPVLKKWKG